MTEQYQNSQLSEKCIAAFSLAVLQPIAGKFHEIDAPEFALHLWTTFESLTKEPSEGDSEPLQAARVLVGQGAGGFEIKRFMLRTKILNLVEQTRGSVFAGKVTDQLKLLEASSAYALIMRK